MSPTDTEIVSIKSSSHLVPATHQDDGHDHYVERIFETGAQIPASVFQETLEEVRHAIDHGVFPSLISQGSSGSYFCRDRQGKIVAVFKPKNEEPYGEMNPKWTKRIHRIFFPCCFGRSCLIPNSGYMSEAAASVVDIALDLRVVPRTEVVQLAAPPFNYTWVQRRRHTKRGKLPLKTGSFQLFVAGYKDASLCFQALQDDPLSPELKRSFRAQFERLVILDYIIRNTDRGNQNWLVKLQKEEPNPRISIAAIDHGLAFPHKHPDNWRFYPFGWATIPAANVPFSDETAIEILQKIEDPDFVDLLSGKIREVYSLDSHFKEERFARQMAVMRGQIYNLVEVLKRRQTPADLMGMPPILITQVESKKGIKRWMFEHRIRAPTFQKC